jgi:transposase
LLRRIELLKTVTGALSWLRGDLAPFCSHTECPLVDPELMIPMLLIGCCYPIRSDRRGGRRAPVRPRLQVVLQ